MFKFIGTVLLIYIFYAIATGRVLAKAGIRVREVLREDSPRYLWMVVAIYSALSVALLTVF